MYVGERVAPLVEVSQGQGQVNIKERKQLTGLHHLPSGLPTFDFVLRSTPLQGVRMVI